MSKVSSFPSSLNDKFLNLDGCQCNGILYDDMNDPKTRRMFEENNGKYAMNNGLTAVIVGSQIYVTPFNGMAEILESYGFERGYFTVPFSVDIYEDYPHAMGPDLYLKVAAKNLNDPVGAIGNAMAQIFESMKFTKWNELVKQATRGEGFEIDLEEYHRKCFNEMYSGPMNRQAREERNQVLRQMIKERFHDNPRLVQAVEDVEASLAQNQGRRRR